jgi:hypothetical protein
VPTLQRWFELTIVLAAGVLAVVAGWSALAWFGTVGVDQHEDLFGLTCGAIPLVPFVYLFVKRRLDRRALRRFAAGAGWLPVDPERQDWPWTDLLHHDDPERQNLSGKIRIRSAWQFQSGFPITVGEITSSGRILEGAVTSGVRPIVFVLIDLPQPAGSMAMRVPYEHLGFDIRDRAAGLNIAFLHGEIPPWTVRGHELFTFQRPRSGLRPNGIREAVRTTLRVAELLGIRSPSL